MKKLLVLLALLFASPAMAGTVYLTEFATIAIGPAGAVAQVAVEPELVDQTITSSGTAAASSAVNAKTRIVRITTDSIVCVTSGTTPVATAGMRRMAADTVEYFAVPLAASWKFSVITCS